MTKPLCFRMDVELIEAVDRIQRGYREEGVDITKKAIFIMLIRKGIEALNDARIRKQ